MSDIFERGIILWNQFSFHSLFNSQSSYFCSAINKEETVAQKTEVPVVEEPVVVDNTITVEEYFRQLGVTGDVVV